MISEEDKVLKNLFVLKQLLLWVKIFLLLCLKLA